MGPSVCPSVKWVCWAAPAVVSSVFWPCRGVKVKMSFLCSDVGRGDDLGPSSQRWWVEARLLAGVGWAGRLGGWCDPARTLEPTGGWRADPRLGGRLGGRAFCPGPGLLPVVLTSLGTRKDKLRFPLFCVWFYCFVFALRPRWTAQARRVSVALGLPCASPRRPLGGARAARGITFSKRRGRCFLKF